MSGRPWFADLQHAPYPREKIRAQLLQVSACPPQHVDEVVDIACHAAASAHRALLEVIDRSSEYRVAITAIGIAVSLAKADAELLGEGLMHAAAQCGLKSWQGQIGGSSHG